MAAYPSSDEMAVKGVRVVVVVIVVVVVVELLLLVVVVGVVKGNKAAK